MQLRPLTTSDAVRALAAAVDLLDEFCLADPGSVLASRARVLLAKVAEAGSSPAPASPVEARLLAGHLSNCRSCPAEVIWTRTVPNDRPMPLDPVATSEGLWIVVGNAVDDKGRSTPQVRRLHRDEPPPEGIDRFTSHFETCPNASEHSRGNGR